MRSRLAASASIAVGVLLAGCPAPKPKPAPAPPAAFVDVAQQMGVRYTANVAKVRPRDILQTNGSGCAFLDYDGDGRLDILLVGEPKCALYHNEGDHFRDVTAEAGLDHPGHWIGVGVGDFDNDGWPDVCLTGYHTGALLGNDHGRFRDVTAVSGLQFPSWGQSVAFGDTNNDGLLDLYLGAYAKFGPQSQRYCYHGQFRSVCGPELYTPELGRLFLNRGNGKFEEITKPAGLDRAHGKAWGAAFQDYDDDGRQDLYIGNDMLPGDLFHNEGVSGGIPHFTNKGTDSGTAYDASGHVQGAMAVDWADFDSDGRPDLLVTAFFAQPTSIYRNTGSGLFTECGNDTGVAPPTLPFVGFGGRFIDYDNDGRRDLFLANGHVEDGVEQYRPDQHYRQPILLLRNRGGRFENASNLLAGLPPIVARGAAFGDFDNDGRVDALVMDLEGQPLLLRNQSPGGHWLGLRLIGSRSNRDGIGARVFVSAGGVRQRLECQTSGSVLSSQDPRLLFGLAAATHADEVTIRWPSGRQTVLKDLPADRYLTVREP